MKFIILALNELVPDAQYSFEGKNLDSINWIVEPKVKPTAEQILSKAKEIEQEQIEQQAIDKENKKLLLQKLGITEDEAKLLLS